MGLYRVMLRPCKPPPSRATSLWSTAHPAKDSLFGMGIPLDHLFSLLSYSSTDLYKHKKVWSWQKLRNQDLKAEQSAIAALSAQ